jgi:hypothetical protein
MANATQGQDFGIIYYVGHGNIASNGSDLTLAIYEEPVASDQGYRVSDLLGLLQLSIYRSSIAEIPHFFIILDACFSGTVAQSSKPAIQTIDGVQHLVEIPGGGPVIPDQMAILTSTAAGSSSSAYELQGSGLSAFGYYFARALKEDWACSDSLSRDGILTLLEMKQYLKERLKLASDKGAVAAAMSPSMLARDGNALLAYRADKYLEPGFRDLIFSLLIQPGANQTAELVLPGGARTSCSDSTSGCTVPISKTYAGSNLTLAVRSKNEDIEVKGTVSPEIVSLADLMKRSKTLLGVKLQVTQLKPVVTVPRSTNLAPLLAPRATPSLGAASSHQ